MARALCAAVLMAVAAAGGLGQQRNPRTGRSLSCDDTGGWRDDDRVSRCEVREDTIPGYNPIDVDAGRNGGIAVHGWDRGDVLVRSKIVASAPTAAEASRLLAAIRISAGSGAVRADGPPQTDDTHWSASFDLRVPRSAMLTLHTQNGGIAIDAFHGAAEFRAQNGGISLVDVGGDIRGGTTNGGVNVDLEGDRWDGAGLDVTTTNGGVKLVLPAHYSAQLETRTTHGRIRIDAPMPAQGSIGRRISTTLGSGGATLRLVTTNGGIIVREK
jgi:putative adhesin